jgi:anthranilate synthase component 1
MAVIRTMPITTLLPAQIDLLDLHIHSPGRYPFLLESVAGGTAQGRFDILFAFPGESLCLDDSWELSGNHAGQPGQGFLAALDAWWAAERYDSAHGRAHGHEQDKTDAPPDLPFQGGWFVFLAYELVRETEPTVRPAALPGFPVALEVRVPVALIRERDKGQLWLLSEPGHEAAIRLVTEDIEAVSAAGERAAAGPQRLAESIAEPDPDEFLIAVARARELISAGDVFQVNLARQWSGKLRPGVQPWQIYRRLREVNPAPFSGLARFGDRAIVSSSPERLVRVSRGRVETRPIAGTRPRAGIAELEEERRSTLLSNAKERAEHVMLIDLERNDLGRICVPGTIAVNELMTVESYAHVHHIVSNICGELRADVTPGMLMKAVFPGGTITGCPKVRCMEIICDLETQARGPYTGSMGYLNHDGSCDFNILIRTIQVRGDTFALSAGSGIVADSVAERELEETRAKAKGMLLALES